MPDARPYDRASGYPTLLKQNMEAVVEAAEAVVEAVEASLEAFRGRTSTPPSIEASMEASCGR